MKGKNSQIIFNMESKKEKELLFQKKLVLKLRKGKLQYEDAGIYTVLYDLVDSSSIADVFMMLHSLASDLDLEKKLKKEIKLSKTWNWSK